MKQLILLALLFFNALLIQATPQSNEDDSTRTEKAQTFYVRKKADGSCRHVFSIGQSIRLCYLKEGQEQSLQGTIKEIRGNEIVVGDVLVPLDKIENVISFSIPRTLGGVAVIIAGSGVAYLGMNVIGTASFINPERIFGGLVLSAIGAGAIVVSAIKLIAPKKFTSDRYEFHTYTAQM